VKRTVWAAIALAFFSLGASRPVARSRPSAQDMESSGAALLRRLSAEAERLRVAGEIYFELGQYEAARKAWSEALATAYSDEILGRLAKLCRQTRQFNQLIELERKRLAASPGAARRAALAEAFHLAGRAKDAESLWMAILAEGRWSAAAVKTVVVSCQAVGRPEFAEAILRKCSDDSMEPHHMNNMAELSAIRGRYGVAIATMERYLARLHEERYAEPARKRWAFFVTMSGKADKVARGLDADINRLSEEFIKAGLAQVAASSGNSRRAAAAELARFAPDDPRVRSALAGLPASRPEPK